MTDLDSAVSGLPITVGGRGRELPQLLESVPPSVPESCPLAGRPMPVESLSALRDANRHYSCLVFRWRPRRKRRSEYSRGNAAVLVAILVWIAIPVLTTVVLQTLSTRPSLSDLVVRPEAQAVDPRVLGWPDLVLAPERLQVRLLGYMMDDGGGVPDGKIVPGFVLLPDAGTALHPAHRVPAQMVRVQIRGAVECRFEFRRLVWVEGFLSHCQRLETDETHPLYCLGDAVVEKAGPGDILDFFTAPR